MEVRAILFIACLVCFRLYTLFGLHILHSHSTFTQHNENMCCTAKQSEQSEQSEQAQYEQLLYDEQKYPTNWDKYADESASSWTPEKLQDAQQLAQDIGENYEKQVEFHRLDRHNREKAHLQEYNQSTKIPAIYILPSIFMTFLFIYGLIMYRNADDDDDYKNLYFVLFLIPTASVGLTILILLCRCCLQLYS